MVSAQVPGEVAPAVQTVGGLFVHQPPALLRPQLLLKLQRVRLLPQSVLVPAPKKRAEEPVYDMVLSKAKAFWLI